MIDKHSGGHHYLWGTGAGADSVSVFIFSTNFRTFLKLFTTTSIILEQNIDVYCTRELSAFVRPLQCCAVDLCSKKSQDKTEVCGASIYSFNWIRGSLGCDPKEERRWRSETGQYERERMLTSPHFLATLRPDNDAISIDTQLLLLPLLVLL